MVKESASFSLQTQPPPTNPIIPFFIEVHAGENGKTSYTTQYSECLEGIEATRGYVSNNVVRTPE